MEITELESLIHKETTTAIGSNHALKVNPINSVAIDTIKDSLTNQVHHEPIEVPTKDPLSLPVLNPTVNNTNPSSNKTTDGIKVIVLNASDVSRRNGALSNRTQNGNNFRQPRNAD
jgi:hypothetical protein